MRAEGSEMDMGRKKKKKKKVEREVGWRMMFWNIAGLGNKDRDFWKELENWDVIILSETWVEERNWGKVKSKLPRGFIWNTQWATKENKRGRAMGGMIMGIREEMAEKEKKGRIEKEGMMVGKVRVGKENWRIIGIYRKGNIEEYLRVIEEWMGEGKKGDKVVVGGDFNVRTGREGGAGSREEDYSSGEKKSRNSKDGKINGEGRKLVEKIEEWGWSIWNGNTIGDEEGEFTFTGGKGNTVIDYIIGDEEARGRIREMKIGEKVDSDHHPLEVWVEGETQRRKKEKREQVINKIIWDGEGQKKFRENLRIERKEGVGVDEEWRDVETRIKKALKVVGEKQTEGKKRRTGWWDEECKEKKKEVKRELREWRRGNGGKERYWECKRKYREHCERKKREETERWMKEAENVKKEGDVWKLVNKGRRKKRTVDERIEQEEWKEHFMRLLGGVEHRVRVGEERRGREGEEGEISGEEIKVAIKRIKERKATGVDGVPGEVWRYGGEDLTDWARDFCNKVWKGEGWPEEWKEGVIVPVFKKGKGKKAEDYRGITLMTTLYKIYTMVLTERLRLECEEKKVIPQNQTGFRKGVGTMDNIYVVNYLVNRQLGKKKKVVGLFVDLKAAFDSVDRGVLYQTMREKGIREGLIERVREILRETKSRVKVGEEWGESFWAARGLRQGCPLSPTLFSILIADLEEEMEKVKWGGVKVGGRKVYSLAYADDIVLLAEEEEEMRSMIERLEGYMERKKLELNVNKTKIMRFRKGGGRVGKKEWRWKGRKIEEVKEITYLGYRLQRNGSQEAQVKDRVKKAAMVMGEVWGLGKRRFGKDWNRRIWLFDRLVWTVMSYGVEIWGWKEREGMERLEERYLRWLFGIDNRTPGYLLREEIKRYKLRERAGRRAWGFEKRLEEGKGSELTRLCWEEMRERCRKGKVGSDWEEERGKFFMERGMEVREVERRRTEGELWFGELIIKDKEKQREEREQKIRESRYCRWYGVIKTDGVPEYLKKGWGESKWKRMMRYRLGNEMGESAYWEGEEKRLCRTCGSEEETWEHVWERCRDWGLGRESWQDVVEWVLGERGEGEEWMRRVDEERKNMR